MTVPSSTGQHYPPLGVGSIIADGDKGDITVSSSGTVWTIDNDAVTYAKLQNVSATNRFLGRITSGAGNAEELTASQALTILGAPFSPGTGLDYMYPFSEAIPDAVNDNFRDGDGAGGMDTSGTRTNPVTPNAWTAENIGSTTIDVSDGRAWLTSPASASIQVRGYYQPVPSGNWCIRMCLSCRPGVLTAGQRSVGMYLRDSSSGKLETWGIAYSTTGATHLWSGKYTNATTYSATRNFTVFGLTFLPSFIEIEYDGTNYYLRFGLEDQPGYLFISFAKTDFLAAAADGIGIFTENDESDPNTLIARGFYRVAVSSVL